MQDLPYKRISVIGLGYIGLPTAAMFASHGVEVIGVDVNPHTVGIVNSGDVPIAEPDLELVLQTAVREGYLRATLDPSPQRLF